MIWNLLSLSLLVLSYSTIQDHHQYHHPPQPSSSSSLSLSSSSSTLGPGPIQYMWPLSLTFLIIWWLHGQTHSPQHLMYPTSIRHIAHRCHQCQTYGVFQTKICFSTNVILTISCKVLRVLAQKDCHRAAFTPKVRLLHTRQRSHYQITIIIINIIIRVYLSELLHNEIRTVDFSAYIALYTQSLRAAISKIRFLARSWFSCPVSKCKT